MSIKPGVCIIMFDNNARKTRNAPFIRVNEQFWGKYDEAYPVRKNDCIGVSGHMEHVSNKINN